MSDTSKAAIDELLQDIDFEAVNSEIDRGLARSIVSAIRALTKERDELRIAMEKAVGQISDLASAVGRAEGKLEASELPGILDGWKYRAEKAEAEVERLREALTLISDNMDLMSTGRTSLIGYTKRIARQALDALQRKEGNE